MIRTTHVGSLPRSDDVLEALGKREAGGPEPDPELIRRAVADCVDKQVELGLDILNDGETGKASYVTYVRDRLTGFTPGRPPPGPHDNALDDFPEFAVRAWSPDRVAAVCSGEVRYRDTGPVEADIAALRDALAAHPGREGFLTAASPGVVDLFHATTHYADRESYLLDAAEAMKVEYDAIHAAGLLLQLDCPDLAVQRTFFPPDEDGLAAFRRLAAQNVAVLNHALRDIPPERVRLHLCWGNSEAPHTRDVALRDVLDIVLGARAGTLSFEGANPRHGHEWAVFTEVELPEDRCIQPGVVDTSTHFVEHPELVAERIERYARAVGPERVVAGTDCGMATFAAGGSTLDGRVAWAKLASLVEGARLASARLAR
ncbi:cobalamin-independent methionine synthase II family protein [Pseudonocardia lacus]|uniref:cobalamin-independent methionine synthase II family protein n=1 Tax=Pseudonocardia lacus TaxID=2835865 RepID=UPI001BDCCB2C|nr:cobalamin-independent methionine synthase II family protein [Pseudonocardia lacus]